MWKIERPRGFSIAEMLIAAFTFLLVFGVGLWAVSRGMHMHAEASVKQSLQREIQAIAAFMEEDGSKTNFFRTGNEARPIGDGRRRDGLAMVAMDSWQESVALDAIGLPAWNNLIAYVATRDEPYGRLVRQVIQPAAVPIQDAQVPPLLSAALSGVLPGGDTLLSERQLSESVDEFIVEPQSGLGLIVCEIALKETLVQTDGQGAQNEVLNVRIMLYPQNTWPKID